MDKFSSDMVKQAYDLGFELFGIMKAASEGDVDASTFIKEAMEAAGADPAMMGAGAPPPAPEPTIPCPQCGNEVTPSPEGICPVCGFDFNTIAGAAGGGAPMMDPNAVAEEIKQAAWKDQNVMAWLIQNHGR